MMRIDLLRGDEIAQKHRAERERVLERRRASAKRYRAAGKHKESQKKYARSAKGRAAINANQAERRKGKPAKPLTSEQRERCRARNRQYMADRYKNDAAFRQRKRDADKARAKLPKGSEQRERARKASRECMRRRMAQWTPEERAAKYAATKAWRRSLSEEQKKVQHEKDVARIRVWSREKYRSDPIWREAQHEKYMRRRSALKGNGGSLDDGDWLALCAAYGGCAYCRRDDVPVTQDHLRAVSRGGPHVIENIVPACRSCNAKKHTMPLPRFLALRNLDTDEFWHRHEAVVAKIRGSQ